MGTRAVAGLRSGEFIFLISSPVSNCMASSLQYSRILLKKLSNCVTSHLSQRVRISKRVKGLRVFWTESCSC